MEASLEDASRELRKIQAAPKETTSWRDLVPVFLQWPRKGSAESDERRAATAKSKDRHESLLKIQKLIEDERRGAYALFFQDPAFFAVLLPSSLFGILAVLIRTLFGGM